MDKRKQLREKYPHILGKVGLEVGEGWLPLIDHLCESLMATPDPPVAVQVKEKFGGLRFYTDSLSEEQDTLISWAEYNAAKTCEVCGAPGKMRNTAWIRTLCDEHAK